MTGLGHDEGTEDSGTETPVPGLTPLTGAGQGLSTDEGGRVTAGLADVAADAADHAARTGERLLDAGRPEDAARAFARAVDLDPERMDHRHRLVLALAAAGVGAATGTACEAMVARRPDCGRTRLVAAQALTLVGAIAPAADHYREALFLWPDAVEAMTGLAALLVDREDLPEAIALLHRALRAAPDLPVALYHLGRARAALGERDEASARFRRCLDLEPEDTLGAAAALAAVAGGGAADLPPAYIRCLFDQYAEGFDEALVFRLRYRGPQVVVDALERVLAGEGRGAGPEPAAGQRRPRDVLDLGCGTGLSGLALRPLARRLAGVDLSPAMVAKARDRGVYDDLAVGEAVAALTAAPGAFDIIAAVDVLVYFGDLGPMLTAARRALRPGGLVVATVEVSARAGFTLMPTRRFQHHPDAVRAAAGAAGFAVTLLEPVTVRWERAQPVESMVFVLAWA